MIVLGVDPGTIRTGWGVVAREGPRFRGLAAGVIDADRKQELPLRLSTIYARLTEAIEKYRPEVMAVEDIFYSRSARAALTLGHARGVALLAAANFGLEVHTYSPALVKKTVAGRGQANKEQVARVIGALLGWRELPPTDATDALSVAITHLNAADFSRRR